MFLLVLGLVAYATQVNGQSGPAVFSGYLVDDELHPLIGVRLSVKGYAPWTATDSTGAFRLELPLRQEADTSLQAEFQFSPQLFAVSRLSAKQVNYRMATGKKDMLGFYISGTKLPDGVGEKLPLFQPLVMTEVVTVLPKTEIAVESIKEASPPKKNVEPIKPPVKKEKMTEQPKKLVLKDMELKGSTGRDAEKSVEQPMKKSVKKMEADQKYARVKVFFATDRALTGDASPNEMFGPDRSPAIHYGLCEVSIPNDHKVGELEQPTWLKLEFSEDPENHVVLLNAVKTSANTFYTLSNQHGGKNPKKKAFVFIHGYNVNFKDAARRTGQIAYDLKFSGIPVFFSWPSQGAEKSYNADEVTVEWAQPHVESFLEEFLTKTVAEEVYIIAHSMGSRVMTRSLGNVLTNAPHLKAKVKEVILAAPDIDADIFKTQIAPRLTANCPNITLYASDNDLALTLSSKLAKYPRAGQTGESLVVLNGIETIDASSVSADLLGHSYFAGTRTVLTDIAYLIQNGNRAKDRFGLKKVPYKGLQYWLFEK